MVPSYPSVVASSEVSFVTVTVKFSESVSIPSDTVAVTKYILFASASEGFSKSGAVIKVTTPEVDTWKNDASVPLIE